MFIGIISGLLGAGPSILTILLLMQVVGMEFRSAVTTSLVVVAGMSFVALIPYIITRAIVWRAGFTFAIASMIGALIGGETSTLIPIFVLKLIFFLSIIIGAVAMLWSPRQTTGSSQATVISPVAAMLVRILVGMLTGLVGLGGGFAIVPLLIVLDNTPVRSAIGTSLFVVVLNTLVGLVGHFPNPPIDWSVAIQVGLAGSLGSLSIAPFARHLSAKTLRHTFACLMLAIAFFLLGSSFLQFEHRRNGTRMEDRISSEDAGSKHEVRTGIKNRSSSQVRKSATSG